MLLRQTSLSANIVQFCRYLRQHNFTMGVEEESLALNALVHIDYHSRAVFRQALEAVLCRSRAQVSAFDQLFADYWKELEKAVDSKTVKKEKPEPKPAQLQAQQFKALKSWLHGNKTDETETTAAYSLQESLSRKDFSMVAPDELPALSQYLKALAKRLAAHTNRRYRADAGGNKPDLRKTLRNNMRRGGELLQLAWRKRKPNRTRLVLLCDVSQSMELYTSFLLQFMYGFQQAYTRTQTFAFGTTLQEITPLLARNDFATAMRQISSQNLGWSGGTRIGECLADFVHLFGKRLINKKTVVIILSDGWDQGDTSGIPESMGWLKSHSRKIIWLNPLAGFDRYQPDTAGMQAALSYIHVLAPLHNLQSLRRLAQYL
jgi:uncharacterized protein with von Willebrand factor type A (vWA) domain